MSDSNTNNMHHLTLHKAKKPWYKRVWVWILIILALLIVIGAANSKQPTATNNTPNEPATSPAVEEQAPAKWDMEAAYAKIQNGMTKAQVEEVTGKKSESCTESQMEYIGKTELCTYGNAFVDKGAITVTYSNDAVSSKTKTAF